MALSVIRLVHPTGRTATLVEQGGQRFIVVFPGINNHFAEQSDLEKLTQAAVAAKIVHLTSFVGVAELSLQQQLLDRIGNESLVSLTPGALYAKRGLDRLKGILKHVDVTFLYKEQLFKLLENSSAKPQASDAGTQQLLEEFYAWRHRNNLTRPQIVLVKDPTQNSFGYIDQRFMSVGVGVGTLGRFFGPVELPARTQMLAVDTTGAGDAAAAGFLYGMMQNASLDDCVDSAFLLACFASTQVGARTAFSGESMLDATKPKRSPQLIGSGQKELPAQDDAAG